MSPADLTELLREWGYPALLFLLCATGIGSPIPEDVLLVAAGYLVSAGVFSSPMAVLLGLAGVVISDVMLYTWGRQMRAGAGGRLRRLVRPERLDRATGWFQRFGDRMVFLARLLPGTRTVVFVGAGLRRMPLERFLLHDVLGAIIWVPVMIWIGTQLGEEIGGIERLIGAFGRTAGWLAVIAVLLLVAWHLWRTEESKL